MGLFSRKIFRKTNGQTLLEFAAIAGVIVTALVVMSPAFKRGIQSVIKVTADQLAAQNEADQVADPAKGYLVNSFSTTRVSSEKIHREIPTGMTEYHYEDTTETASNSFTNMGFNPSGN